jgi:hypothetical protein
LQPQNKFCARLRLLLQWFSQSPAGADAMKLAPPTPHAASTASLPEESRCPISALMFGPTFLVIASVLPVAKTTTFDPVLRNTGFRERCFCILVDARRGAPASSCIDTAVAPEKFRFRFCALRMINCWSMQHIAIINLFCRLSRPAPTARSSGARCALARGKTAITQSVTLLENVAAMIAAWALLALRAAGASCAAWRWA